MISIEKNWTTVVLKNILLISLLFNFPCLRFNHSEDSKPLEDQSAFPFRFSILNKIVIIFKVCTYSLSQLQVYYMTDQQLLVRMDSEAEFH